ncbi:MAG: hypothetical protein HC781_13480 [Leptolyngbyaceae cyanobacterium CSU_1_4]|nr:hypothetical protein [Leptolyngbyaceae cyanobacterium CSU_1_4]
MSQTKIGANRRARLVFFAVEKYSFVAVPAPIAVRKGRRRECGHAFFGMPQQFALIARS